MEILIICAILTVGLFAGFINVIVGSGSSITVPFLTFLGIPTILAIGTNRFAMLFNNGLGGLRYYQKKYLDVKLAIILSIFAAIGSIFGAYWVLSVKQDTLNKMMGIILIIEAGVILLNHNLLGINKIPIKIRTSHHILGSLFCLCVGVYGGFIGLAITSIIMFLMIAIFRVRFIESAAITKVITFSISFFASIIFITKMKIDWIVAPILVLSYLIGAYLGVHSAIKMGNTKIKVLFVLVAIVSAIKLLFF